MDYVQTRNNALSEGEQDKYRLLTPWNWEALMSIRLLMKGQDHPQRKQILHLAHLDNGRQHFLLDLGDLVVTEY